jgi:hypothetical protein
MIRDPRIYAATRTATPRQAAGRPLTLRDELQLICPNTPHSHEHTSLFQYETTLSMLLDAGQAHYSPVLKQLYFWNDLDGAILKTLRSAYLGAGVAFSIQQLGMDRHGFFRCTYKIALPDDAFASIYAALQIAGIRLILRPLKPTSD